MFEDIIEHKSITYVRLSDGRRIPVEDDKKLTIANDHFILVDAYTGKRHAVIDFTIDEGPHKGKSARAAYEDWLKKQ